MNVTRLARNVARAAIGTPPFLGQHALRQRYLDRRSADVEHFSEPSPDVDLTDSHAPKSSAIQSRADGCGPLVSRVYSVEIIEPELTAEELLARFAGRPEDFVPRHIAGFFIDDRPATSLSVGDEVVVEIPGPWNGPVRVVDMGATSMLLATLDGHMEAGLIRFKVDGRPGTGRLRFEIRSWARAGDEFFKQLHLSIRLGQEAQTAMWVHTCDRAVAISGGRRVAPIRATTETLKDSEVNG